MPTVGAGSVRDALDAASAALEAAGCETPRLDAELLLAETSGRDRARLAADSAAAVDPAAARRFGEMVRRRLRREPVAYILGRKGFRRIELAVDRRALIPRPETELLVEVAIDLRPTRVLDVGTGSGAVALAVADEMREVEVVATDTSAPALELARENAARLGLAQRVAFEHASLPAGGGEFDLLVANLPYVSEADYRTLQPEISRYEPREAVVAGRTGLEAIERLLGELTAGAVEASSAALEVGAGQAGAVEELIRRAGYDAVDARRDIAGIERVVVGKATGR